MQPVVLPEVEGHGGAWILDFFSWAFSRLRCLYDCLAMCGRYVLTDLERFLERQAWVRRPEGQQFLKGRYNIAPQQEIAAVLAGREAPSEGVVKPLRWGLVPSWAKDESVGNRMINARAESLLEKPAFTRALAKRRCLIPADGFYEWKKPAARRGRKQPYVFRLRGDEPFAFAGLWEVWHDPSHRDRPPLYTCTIITGEPNDLVAPVHNRMPVILQEADYRRWLDVTATGAESAARLLVPFPAERMYAYPVDARVGNVENDDAALIEPCEDEPPPDQPPQDESPGLFD